VESSDETREHVDVVAERVGRVAPADLRRVVQLAAKVHEERDPVRLREAADAAGAGDDAETVVAVTLAFGEIWKLSSDHDVDAFVMRNAPHLRALLAFKLAHEGAPTDVMKAIAERAGFADEFAAWADSGLV
jgi:hypothetical protein